MRIFFLMIVILLGAASRAAEVQKTEGVWKIVDRQSRSIMSAGSDGRVIKGIEALCGESGTMVLRLLLVQPQSGQLAIGSVVTPFDSSGYLNLQELDVAKALLTDMLIADRAGGILQAKIDGQPIKMRVSGMNAAMQTLIGLCTGKARLPAPTVAATNAPIPGNAATVAEAIYPFEGYWRVDGIQSDCSADKKHYSHIVYEDVDLPKAIATEAERCPIKSVVKKGAGYVVKLACKDTSGDGPTNFIATQEIALNGPDAMTVKGQGMVNTFKRCPATSAQATPQVAPTAQPAQAPLPQAAVAPQAVPSVASNSSENPPSNAIINALVAGNDAALRSALRASLPGYSCEAEGDLLHCTNGSYEVKASAPKKAFFFQIEISTNPDRFPQSRPVFQLIDRLGSAIGLQPSDIHGCWTAPGNQAFTEKVGGLKVVCQTNSHFTKQMALTVQPDTSF